jgi:hypothetical protein
MSAIENMPRSAPSKRSAVDSRKNNSASGRRHSSRS